MRNNLCCSRVSSTSSTRQTHRHEEVSVVVACGGVGLSLAREDRGPRRNGEPKLGVRSGQGPEPVEEVGRVEGDRDVIALETCVQLLGCLRLVTGAGLEGQLTGDEAEPDRGVALGDKGDTAYGLDQRVGLDGGDAL
jgi:hypothetical protein